jgi:Ca2+-binding RTX toxin-like protein
VQNIECLQLFGNNGNDTLVNDTNPLSSVGSLIDGGDGNDLLVGGNATDVIFGGDGVDTIYGRGGNDFLFGDHEFNNRSPQVKHSSSGDMIFGDAPTPAILGLPSYVVIGPGVDKIVAIGSDTISAGGQIGDTIVGLGLHITVVDWLKARFLNPNGANIQAVINQALAVPCTMI